VIFSTLCGGLPPFMGTLIWDAIREDPVSKEWEMLAEEVGV
jgi:hypothetical protein